MKKDTCQERYSTYIRGMTKEERQRAKEKEQCNASSEQQQRDNTSAMPLQGLCKQ